MEAKAQITLALLETDELGDIGGGDVPDAVLARSREQGRAIAGHADALSSCIRGAFGRSALHARYNALAGNVNYCEESVAGGTEKKTET